MQPALPIPPKPVDSVSNDPSFNAATISSGPQPASMYPTPAPPVMLPPLHYQGLDSVQPFGYQPPPGRVPPSFTPTAAVPPPANATGTVRPADQMEGDADEVPPAKRQRVAKLPGGQYYPEQDWINMHPVRFCHSFIIICYIKVLNVENSIRFRCKCSCRRIRACPSGSWTARS